MSQIDISSPLEAIFRLTDIQKSALKRISVSTADDLLRYLPFRYINPSQIKSISELRAGESAALEGIISSLDTKKTWKKKLKITEARLADSTGSISIAWFHQPYVSRMLQN